VRHPLNAAPAQHVDQIIDRLASLHARTVRTGLERGRSHLWCVCAEFGTAGRSAMNTPRLWPTVICALNVAACAVTSPIQSASTSKSAFEGAVYKGRTVIISPGTPGNPTFRVFIQGATGFVSMQSVRDDAEQRATAFCDRKGKAMQSLTETTATPPYILGNFPRIEIVFDCIDKLGSPAPAAGDDKYAKLAKLKQLLDSGAITQEEFNAEKAKILVAQ
jgi:hypothetical protein